MPPAGGAREEKDLLIDIFKSTILRILLTQSESFLSEREIGLALAQLRQHQRDGGRERLLPT